MKRIFSHILMLIAIVCITAACCIREDLSECNSELILRFRYTLNTQNQNLFETNVSNVNVYLFDADNKYIGLYKSSKAMSNQDLMRIELPEGKYSAVVLGANYNTYKVGEIDNTSNSIATELIKGETDINNFRLELLTQASSDGYLYPSSKPDHIYMGSVYSVASLPNNEAIVDVDLIKLTKDIVVNVINTNELPTKSYEYDATIKNQNGRYDHHSITDNTHGVVKYNINEYVQSKDTLSMKTRVMRLMVDDTPTLDIINTASSQTLYSKNMIDLIMLTNKYKTQEDIDREDQFEFNILMYKDILMSVTVNGWVVVEIEPEM